MELLSIATDPPEAWREVADEEDIALPLLSDPGAKVSTNYGVMAWGMGGEPGHTFVLVEGDGTVAWIGDYGAPENGGLMYVDVPTLIEQVKAHL